MSFFFCWGDQIERCVSLSLSLFVCQLATFVVIVIVMVSYDESYGQIVDHVAAVGLVSKMASGSKHLLVQTPSYSRRCGYTYKKCPHPTHHVKFDWFSHAFRGTNYLVLGTGHVIHVNSCFRHVNSCGLYQRSMGFSGASYKCKQDSDVFVAIPTGVQGKWCAGMLWCGPQ